MFLSVLLLKSEIISYVKIHGAKGVVGMESRFPIVIGMNDDARARVPSHIIIYDTEAAYTVQVDILENEAEIVLAI